MKKRKPLNYISFLILDHNFPTTQSNRDEIILKEIFMTTPPIYDNHKMLVKSKNSWERLKSGSVNNKQKEAIKSLLGQK
jgi:hypothetical protein